MLTTKLFSYAGLFGEFNVGGGAFVDRRDIYGMISGEVFLSTRIGKNIVAGIPLTYNYITYERNQLYTAGISIRFHM